MGKAGKKLIAGAKEALAVARGKAMPAKATKFGWMEWNPAYGLGGFVYNEEGMARGCADPRSKVVRVKIETINDGDLPK